MKKRFIFIFLFILSGYSAFPQQTDEKALVNAMHTITSQQLMDYVKEICNPKYEGRLTGTPGYDECAGWLASEFREWGLTPAGDNGSYFQVFPLSYTLVLPGCEVSMILNQGKNGPIIKHYKYVDEFMPGSTSANGEVTAEVIYAGYGITAPELGYDDYAGIDVKGKIILIEREAPVSPEAGPEKFNQWYNHSFHQSKLENAVRHGAAGMLYNYGPISNPNNSYDENFIYVHVGDSVVNDVFAGTGLRHNDVLKKINTSLKPSSFNTKKIFTIKMSTTHIANGKGSNITGLIRGSDPVLSKEVIIIGAHLDGLGKCYEIIPGANDNASAVAVMMGVAKALSESKIQLRRSVMFLSFGSEEQAIMGSKAYLENPVFDLNKSVLLNMDGVGIGHSIGANAGKNYPKLWEYIEKANNDYIHRPLTTNYFANLGRPRLDAARFIKAGVPSLSFYTFGSVNFYHVPQDDLGIIRPEIMEDLCQLLLIATVRMANSDQALR